jgi:hypothetical protein
MQTSPGRVLIKLRRGTSELWASRNPILADGEPGYEIDTRKWKVGNGLTPWNDLPYAGQGSQGIQGPVGPLGPVGPIGPQGVRGIKGDKGDIGLVGPQGPQGEPGVDGDPGPKGDKGDKGDTGFIGPQGPQGPQGDAGPQGLKGDKGDTGFVGPQGPQGLKGDTGDAGAQGVPGPPGNVGPGGPAGPKGDQGDPGAIGPQGNPGPQGLPGGQGPQGLKGDKGDKGDQGLQGLQGNPGPQGLKGDQGDQGIQGPAGAAGAQGPAGAAGAQGPQGIQGPAGTIQSTWRGDWSKWSTTYAIGDVVRYNGSMYLQKALPAARAPYLLKGANEIADTTTAGGTDVFQPFTTGGGVIDVKAIAIKANAAAGGNIPAGTPVGIYAANRTTLLASGVVAANITPGNWGTVVLNATASLMAGTTYNVRVQSATNWWAAKPNPGAPTGLVASVGNMVLDGSSYAYSLAFRLYEDDGALAPDLDATHWDLMVSAGSQGPAGAQGIQGPAGAAGANGSIEGSFKGIWSSGTVYAVNDIVRYQAGLYAMKALAAGATNIGANEIAETTNAGGTTMFQPFTVTGPTSVGRVDIKARNGTIPAGATVALYAADRTTVLASGVVPAGGITTGNWGSIVLNTTVALVAATTYHVGWSDPGFSGYWATKTNPGAVQGVVATVGNIWIDGGQYGSNAAFRLYNLPSTPDLDTTHWDVLVPGDVAAQITTETLLLNDNFAVDSSGNYTAFNGAFTIAGGVLKPTGATLELVHKLITRRELMIQAKMIAGAAINVNATMAIILSYIDNNNYVMAEVGLSAGTSNVNIYAKEGGVFTNVATVQVGTATAAGATRWIRGRIVGDTIYIAWYSTDPEVVGNVPVKSLTATLATDSRRHRFGAMARGGKYGIRMDQVDNTYSIDDLKVIAV